MPMIQLRSNETVDTAVRRFRRICEKAGIISEMKRHEFYEKPTWERKRRKMLAVRRALKKISRERPISSRGVKKKIIRRK